MKINEVIDIVSATQDNNALANSAEDDFLSSFIKELVEDAVPGPHFCDPNVDLERLESDLSYALIEIKKAKDAVTTMKERIDY